MSCQHGNHVDDCDLCNELLSEYRTGVEIGKKEGWEACESCHGIVDGKHMEAESLRQQLETERMRLAACGVVALSNTPESAAKARDMLPEYRSASCDDVAGAVDREMELRQQLASAQERIRGVKEQRDVERTAYLNEFEKNQVIVAENAQLRQQLADLLDWQQKAFAACPNIDTLIATNKVLG